MDDLALLLVRMADETPGIIEVSRLGNGATNDVESDIRGEHGAIRFHSVSPGWIEGAGNYRCCDSLV